MAGIVGLVHHSDANGTPLGAEADAAVFKPLFLDVGLMNAACGIRTLPQETLHDRRFVNTGKMVEQFVGQQLLAGLGGAQRPRLHYWLREGRQSNAEVDFLLEAGGAVIPVEVKAGASGALKSLHQFMALKTPPLAFRLDINPPSRQTVAVAIVIGKESRRVAYPLYSFPLYLAGQAERIAVDLLGQA